MVLKKPYAFLIKYFRIIHIISAVFIGLTLSNYSKITKFFNNYIKSNNQIIGNASTYTSLIIFIFIIIIITFALAMFILMKNKEKPMLLYLLMLIYYVILFISVLVANNIIKQLTETVLTQQLSRIYRDVFLIISLPQYFFFVTSIIRGVGFDIKKFNFQKDLRELEIESDDDEEFEFLVGIDVQLHKRKIRRISRELKYYLLENKTFIFIIMSIIFLPIIIYFVINFSFINKTYKIGNTAKTGIFNYKLNSSYQTQLNYNGKIINKNKKFIILDLEIQNTTSISQKLDNISFYLQSGKHKYYNKPSARNHFLDIGKVYNNEKIPGNSKRNYLFVFELDKSNNKKKLNLNILNDIDRKKGQEIYEYSKFSIRPYNLDVNQEETEHQLNENIRLENKLFYDSTITIKEIEVISTYEYNYEDCRGDVCEIVKGTINAKSSTTNNLLMITYNLKLSDTISNRSLTSKESTFFEAYLKTLPETVDRNVIVSPNIENKVFIEVPKTSDNNYQVSIKTRNENHYIKYNY